MEVWRFIFNDQCHPALQEEMVESITATNRWRSKKDRPLDYYWQAVRFVIDNKTNHAKQFEFK